MGLCGKTGRTDKVLVGLARLVRCWSGAGKAGRTSKSNKVLVRLVELVRLVRCW